jgi:hypothetical protein
LLSNATDCNTTDAIEAAAQTNIRIIREHQARINRAQKMVDVLFDELQEASENRDEIESVIEDQTAKSGQAKRRALLMRAVALPARTATLVNLSSATKTFMGLERQAFNLHDNPSDSEDGKISVSVKFVKSPETAERRRAALAPAAGGVGRRSGSELNRRGENLTGENNPCSAN